MPNCKKCGSPLPEGATYCPTCGNPTQTVTQLTLANWGERFIAWLIDIIILAIIIAPIRLFIWLAWPGYTLVPGVPSWIPFLDFGLGNVAYFLYWFITEGTYGQSFGKMIMHIEVTTLDGKSAGPGRAAIESMGKAYLLPIDLILGWILHPAKMQRIFNYLSGTIVIRT